jgi:hypothetical protein
LRSSDTVVDLSSTTVRTYYADGCRAWFIGGACVNVLGFIVSWALDDRVQPPTRVPLPSPSSSTAVVPALAGSTTIAVSSPSTGYERLPTTDDHEDHSA